MSIEVCNRNEFIEIIKNNRFVLVFLYSDNILEYHYIKDIADSVSRRVRDVFQVVRVNARCGEWTAEMLGKPPRISFFLDGEKAWEQLGLFYRNLVDKRSLARGILYALRRHSLSPSRLGISLDF